MIRLFLSALMACATLYGLPHIAHAEDIAADSKITAVTVYTNRAQITRTAQIDLPAGAHKLMLSDLPTALLPDSLRAEGEAGESVLLGALSYKEQISSQLVSEKERTLDQQLQKLQDESRMIVAEKAALTTRQAFIENLGKQAQSRSNEEISDLKLNPEDWRAAGLALQSDMDEIMKAHVTLEAKLRGVNDEIRKVREELNQLRTGRRSTYEVTIPFESPAATRLTLKLSYQIPNAGWRPLYDARLDTEDESLSLTQYGAVYQRTGEDWSDVALTLSTAQPQRGAGLPDLRPWWVNLWENRPVRAKTMSLAGAADSVAMDGAVMEEMNFAVAAPAAAPQMRMEKAEFAMAESVNSDFLSEYKIVGPSTVLADGSETKLMVGGFETATALAVHIKPQRSTEAYLVADMTLKGDAPLLPGRVALFRDGGFVGQVSLPTLRPGEDSTLSFGIDDQVIVTRKTLKDERKDGILIARENSLTRHYLTRIENRHARAMSIIVEETIPTPQNDKISVNILKDQTTPGYRENYDDVVGLLRWEKDLAAQSPAEVKLGWEVKWPKDQNLSGL